MFRINAKYLITWSGNMERLQTCLRYKIQTFTNQCLGRILGIRWQDKLKQDDLLGRANQEPMEMQVSLQWNPQGKRPRGKPRVSWQRTVVEMMKAAGLNWETLSGLAQNRVRYRCFVDGLCSGRS